MTLDSELIALLACPKCKGALEARPEGFACNNCKLVFVSQDGIVNFLVEEAKPLTH